MPKVWKIKPPLPQEIAPVYQNCHPLVAQLLYNRALLEKDQIGLFLNPKYENLHSAFLFKDMQKAVDRIWQAIDDKEKITIYGDYDADAVTANAVLRQAFRYLGHQNIESYTPDRFSEGYGVNLDALNKIKARGSGLIITVDCGTNSHEAAKWCKENGIDLIITDHHEIIGEMPDAFALINPKNSADAYPDPNITGVGAAFKLAAAILKNPKSEIRNPKLKEGWEKWLLDLVAIGTVADCHELLGENRVLVKYGLLVLAKTKWPGLKALADSSGLDFSAKLPDAYALGFILAPRLNAAGRLEHANTALELLLEEDLRAARQKSIALEELNRRRQEATSRILSEAREQALLIQDRKVLALMSQNWHKGVVGLVAGRLAEEFYRPTIVLQAEGGQATGSARSVGEFNIVEALRYSSRHLLSFGGHKQAAGLTLPAVNFEDFYQTVLDYADRNLPHSDILPVLDLEAEVSDADLELETLGQIARLEPFGVGNPKPKFLVKKAQILSQRQVGGTGQHLQLQIKIGQRVFSAIAFNFRPFDAPQPFDIACELMEDGWNGRKQVKLKIVDVRHSNILSS